MKVRVIDGPRICNEYSITRVTVERIIEQEQPSMITFSGDIADTSTTLLCYEELCNFMDTFGIPYYFVYGNHDHANDFSLLYRGIRLTYGVKTGDGCYWAKDGSMNGCTTLSISATGVGTLNQVYLDLVA